MFRARLRVGDRTIGMDFMKGRLRTLAAAFDAGAGVAKPGRCAPEPPHLSRRNRQAAATRRGISSEQSIPGFAVKADGKIPEQPLLSPVLTAVFGQNDGGEPRYPPPRGCPGIAVDLQGC